MKKHNRRIWGLIIAFVIMLANVMLVPTDFKDTEVKAAESGVEAMSSVDDIQDGLTLHCWNWSYKNIEANMATIAAQGYTAIQTSPIQQAKEATKGKPMGNWWVFYQPMGFHIDNTGNSALGTKAEFESMCATAHEYGIKVIVDVVANHLGNQTGNDLSSAIIADLKNDASCWHDITKNTTDYTKRYDITQWCMNGVPDLNTGSDKVQTYVLNFLKECIDSGADGFRFDAAKHIETPEDTSSNCASDFWPTVINGAVSYAKSTRGINLYCYGELLDNPGGSLPVSAYTKYMSVTDNSWGNSLRVSVNGGNASGYNYAYHKSALASQLVLWAESHDTYANEGSGNISVQNINKTWALVAARADAMGLYFARPGSMSSQQLGAGSVTGWSYPEVKAVNLFHNAFAGQSEYVANQNGIAYCERGTSGVVLVNCSGTSTAVNVTANQMAAGTYKDQITGNTFTVEGGKIKGNIGSTGIAVVYNASGSGNTSDPTPTPTPTGSNVVYLELPSGWSTNVYCYVYENENINNASWPGVAMTKMSNGLYKYEVPNEINNPKVLFTDVTNQYPGANEPGLELSGTMIYQNGSWKTYTVPKGTVVVKYVDASGKSISDSLTLEGEVGTSYSTSAKTISGYTFSKVSGNADGNYTSGQITVQYIYTKNASDTGNSGENETTDNNTGDNSGNNTGGNSGSNTGDNSGGNSGSNTGDNSGGSNSGGSNGSNTGDDSGSNTGDNTGDSNTSGGNSDVGSECNGDENATPSDDNNTDNDSNVTDEEDETTSDNKEDNDNTGNGDTSTPSSEDSGNNDSTTAGTEGTQGNADDNGQKSDKKGFPWPAVVIPLVVIGIGVGSYMWDKKKKAKADMPNDGDNI